MISKLESILFVVGDEGITENELMSVLEVDEITLIELIKKIELEYCKEERGIEIIKFGNRLKLITKKENKESVLKLMSLDDNDNLTESALEVLAIIAYNQPVTRGTVDSIRGVSSAYIVRKLAFKNLIQEIGRSESAGRPVLYGTTSYFLDHFGLKSLTELPNISIDKQIDEVDLYKSKFTEK